MSLCTIVVLSLLASEPTSPSVEVENVAESDQRFSTLGLGLAFDRSPFSRSDVQSVRLRAQFAIFRKFFNAHVGLDAGRMGFLSTSVTYLQRRTGLPGQPDEFAGEESDFVFGSAPYIELNADARGTLPVTTWFALELGPDLLGGLKFGTNSARLLDVGVYGGPRFSIFDIALVQAGARFGYRSLWVDAAGGSVQRDEAELGLRIRLTFATASLGDGFVFGVVAGAVDRAFVAATAGWSL